MPCRECLAATALFAVVAVLMVMGFATPIDDTMLRAVGDIRSSTFTALMRGITILGDGAVEIPIALLLMAALWRWAGRAVAVRYFACAITGEILYVVAKLTFQRPRPDIIPRLGSAGWHSFPSGHAMLAPIVYGVALLLLSRLVAGRAARLSLVALGILVPLGIGLSRVYLGVHYPSDVLGALALGSAWGYLWFGADRSSTCDTSLAPATR